MLANDPKLGRLICSNYLQNQGVVMGELVGPASKNSYLPTKQARATSAKSGWGEMHPGTPENQTHPAQSVTWSRGLLSIHGFAL